MANTQISMLQERKVARPSQKIAITLPKQKMMPSYHHGEKSLSQLKNKREREKERESAREKTVWIPNQIAQMARRPMGRAREKRRKMQLGSAMLVDRFTTIKWKRYTHNHSYQLSKSVDWVIGMLQAKLVTTYERERKTWCLIPATWCNWQQTVISHRHWASCCRQLNLCCCCCMVVLVKWKNNGHLPFARSCSIAVTFPSS